MQAEVHPPTPAASHSLSSARIVRGGRGGQVHHKLRMRPNIHLELTTSDNNLLDSNAHFLHTPFW